MPGLYNSPIKSLYIYIYVFVCVCGGDAIQIAVFVYKSGCFVITLISESNIMAILYLLQYSNMQAYILTNEFMNWRVPFVWRVCPYKVICQVWHPQLEDTIRHTYV